MSQKVDFYVREEIDEAAHHKRTAADDLEQGEYQKKYEEVLKINLKLTTDIRRLQDELVREEFEGNNAEMAAEDLAKHELKTMDELNHVHKDYDDLKRKHNFIKDELRNKIDEIENLELVEADFRTLQKHHQSLKMNMSQLQEYTKKLEQENLALKVAPKLAGAITNLSARGGDPLGLSDIKMVQDSDMPSLNFEELGGTNTFSRTGTNNNNRQMAINGNVQQLEEENQRLQEQILKLVTENSDIHRQYEDKFRAFSHRVGASNLNEPQAQNFMKKKGPQGALVSPQADSLMDLDSMEDGDFNPTGRGTGDVKDQENQRLQEQIIQLVQENSRIQKHYEDQFKKLGKRFNSSINNNTMHAPEDVIKEKDEYIDQLKLQVWHIFILFFQLSLTNV